MNILNATITAIEASEHLSLIQVRVEDNSFHLLLAESSDQNLLYTDVTLAFKETEVILSKTFTATTANIQNGKVTHIERGIVLSQITLAYHETVITSLVPTLTFNALSIHEGDTIYWMVQPSEISLLRSNHGV
ncbi:MAG: hypothetical protein PHO27_01335 [Sulfuricurvum sp.]|nr:hypothetical protein [Sulfuricurvum sp.]